MAESSNEQKNFFKNLHTDQYKWNDFFLIPLIVTIVMMFVGQMGFLVITNILLKPIINDNNVDFLTIFQQYSTFLGIWIIALLYCYFTPKNRPIINALTPFCKGNTVKYLLLGLLIGFAYDVGFGVEATIVAITLLIVSCIIVYLWGSKNNKKPTEIWN